MRTNKNIHEEAAAVLYGENWFTWSLYGDQYRPMWRWSEAEKIKCPRHYSRLITKMRLLISTKGDENDPTQADAIYLTTTNVKHACKKFAFNDFKILKVDFYNGLSYRYGGSARKGYYGERCLEPLKKCRAENVSIDSFDEGGFETYKCCSSSSTQMLLQLMRRNCKPRSKVPRERTSGLIAKPRKRSRKMITMIPGMLKTRTLWT